jgi:hypothetical protein
MGSPPLNKNGAHYSKEDLSGLQLIHGRGLEEVFEYTTSVGIMEVTVESL